jgi:hypothetical protein
MLGIFARLLSVTCLGTPLDGVEGLRAIGTPLGGVSEGRAGTPRGGATLRTVAVRGIADAGVRKPISIGGGVLGLAMLRPASAGARAVWPRPLSVFVRETNGG